MNDFFEILYKTFNQISPFLIIGFLISGFLSVCLTVEQISKYLGKQNLKSIFLGSIFGVPIPLCSCGVIPVTAYLRKHGASKASATSFFLAFYFLAIKRKRYKNSCFPNLTLYLSFNAFSYVSFFDKK